MDKSDRIVPLPVIEQAIFVVRGERVLMDETLAKLYGVSTGRLNEAVKRSIDRFPADFMFRLEPFEWEALKKQTKRVGRGGRQQCPYVFTEHGAVMLANVLNSSVAVQTGIQIVRAFIKMRMTLGQHTELATQLHELEQTVYGHDGQIQYLIATIRELMNEPKVDEKRIGF